MCVNYGGRAELVDGFRDIAKQVAAGELNPRDIKEETIAQHLYDPDMPDVDLFLRPWEVDISRRTSLDSPLPVQVLEASPKGHYTQLVVQPLGWYNEPLTVVMHGDDAPQRGERLFVGLQHARLYNGDERIETRDEELALAQSA